MGFGTAVEIEAGATGWKQYTSGISESRVLVAVLPTGHGTLGSDTIAVGIHHGWSCPTPRLGQSIATGR